MTTNDLQQLTHILGAFDQDTIKAAVEELGLRIESLDGHISEHDVESSEAMPIKKRILDFPSKFPGESSYDERVIDEPEFLPVHFLEEGAHIQKAVARIQIGNLFGSGFLVSHSLLITNNHVLPDQETAKKAKFEFNYQDGFDGTENEVDIYRAEPDDFFYTNPALDYTIVRVSSSSSSSAGEKWGCIPLQVHEIIAGERCSIIQHAASRRKEVTIHDNRIIDIFSNVIRYRSDTEHGSSGSPVFNSSWDLIAIHHAGGERDWDSDKWLSNEGVRIDRIIEDLSQYLKATGAHEILSDLGIDQVKPEIVAQ